MGKLRNQSILLLGFLTPFYTTISRSFAEKKHPLSTGQRVFLFNEINPCGFMKCPPGVKYG